MKIPVSCEGCGHRFEVDASFAGRRGTCRQCGHAMTILAAGDVSAPASAEDGYRLREDPDAAAAGTFVRSRRRNAPNPADVPKRPARGPKSARRRRRGDTSFDWRSPGTRRALTIGPAIIVILAIISLFVPRMMIVVGSGISILGLILTVYGYVTAIYIAFSEDDLHGWLFLMIPMYAAYYLVSRWDEMKSRLAMIVIGLVLLSVGSWMIESGRARSNPADPPKFQALARA